METPAHRQLKDLAVRMLVEVGFPAAASEVACPISRYRIDAAGYRDPVRAERPAPAGLPEGAERLAASELARRLFCPSPDPATTFIECKATRADFLRDSRSAPALLRERDDLRRRLDEHEQTVVRELEPHLRASEGLLFPDMERWNFNASRSPARRAILRQLRQVERALYDTTKFFMIAQYRLADWLFVLAPRGMVRPEELPMGWGLLESGSQARDVVRAQVVDVAPSPAHRRARALRNIAAAATRASMAARGASDTFTSAIGSPSLSHAPDAESAEHRSCDGRAACTVRDVW